MVEHIEKFCAELKAAAFANAGVFDQRHAYIPEARTVKNVPARIAEASVVCKNEGAGIEPFFGSGILQRAGPDPVGTVIGAESQARNARVAVVDLGKQGNREWPSALQRYDAVGGPAGKKSRN